MKATNAALHVAITPLNPRGAGHHEETSIGICPIACSTCAAHSGMRMVRMRGDGNWAMSLRVSLKPSTSVPRSKRSCTRYTRNMLHHAWHAPNPPAKRATGVLLRPILAQRSGFNHA